MSTYTVDSSTINLRDILSIHFTEADFTIVDYVYDATPDDDDYTEFFGAKFLNSVINRKNSVFVCELSLKVNTESFFNSPIDGYVVRISPEDDTTNFYQQVCYFSDDFEGIIDIGELDTKAIKAKLNEAKTFMSYETPSDDAALSSVTTQVASNYVNLDAGTDFSVLAKTMVTQGLSPVEELHLTMPTFALPSAKTNFGAVGHSASPYATGLIEKQARMLYGYPGFTDEKISLTAQRDASRPDASDSEASYALQNSLRSDGAHPNPQSEIILGRIYKYTTDYFVSKRKFEIPRRYIDAHSLGNRRVKITFKPFILDENLIGPTGLYYEPQFGEFYTKDIHAERDVLFTPKNPPSLRITHTSPGLISYEINRGDPVVELCHTQKSYFDPVTGQISEHDSSKLHHFVGTKDTVIVINEECRNVAPSYPMIVVATSVNGELGLTNSIISKSFPNPLHSGHSRQDTLKIIGFNDFEGINIEVTSIPPEVFKVILYREDLSLPTSAENRIRQLTKESVGASTEFAYFDTDTANARRYRYFAKCIRTSGAAPRNLAESGLGRSFGPIGALYEEYIAVDDEVVDRTAPGNARLFDVSISHTSTQFTEHLTKYIFSVEATPKDTDINFVLESLRRDGLLDHYLNEFSDRMNDLSTVLGFIVERINRTTGERKTLDTLARPGQTFTDTSADLSARDNVTFIFKTCLLNPGSFITATDPSESVESRTASLAAITEAFSASTGITPLPDTTVASVSLLGMEGLISEAHTGQDYALTVHGEPSETIPTNFKGITIPAGGLILSWEVPYTLESQVHAFLVNCTLNGVALAPKTVSVVLTDHTNKYTWHDVEYYYEVGTKSYSVSCIFNDLTVGPPTSTISYTREASVPSSGFPAMEPVPADSSSEIDSFEAVFGTGIF